MMVYTQVRNPRYTEEGLIECEVLFEQFAPEWLPFCASPEDVEEHGRQIFAECVTGKYGEPAPFVLEFEVAKERKYQEYNAWVNHIFGSPHLMSSVGFKIDADDTANANIDGLIKGLEAGQIEEPIYFMDYNNELHPVTLENLKTMQLEIIANGQSLYQQKWALRNQLESAETFEELNAVVIPQWQIFDEEVVA